MAVVFLALGSNVGDSVAYIDQAILLLSEHVTSISGAPLYSSKAVGYTDQPNFINTVIKGSTKLSPQSLLRFVKKVERQVGRIYRFRWGPREIDIDIIFYGNQIVDKPSLTLPHARFRERDFVLRPLCDLAPTYVDPVTKQTVQELLHRLPATALAILDQSNN